MRVLYIGGTGEISYECLLASVEAGHQCTVFNRGQTMPFLPPVVRQVVGDMHDLSSYSALGAQRFDVVCQFNAYAPADVHRDIEIFAGQTGQYVFVSSASAYEKPPRRYLITEDTPLRNPYWAYSQAKADMERLLLEAHDAGRLPVTIVRPSHTYRLRFPGTFVKGDVNAWRMLNQRAVIVHGDGQSLWTLTHSRDFARPFVKLLGNPRAVGQAFHVTGRDAYTWDRIIQAEAAALGVELRLVHVPSETLVKYRQDWVGPLFGDKMWSTLFDLSKLESAVGPVESSVALDEGLKSAAEHVRRRIENSAPDESLHRLLDRVAYEQASLGQ